MAKPFKNLVGKMPLESQKRALKLKEELLRDVTLRELRQALELTQRDLAKALKVEQSAISKIESESDMFVTTLRRYVRAMGGNLKIIAVFPGGEVTIDQFSDVVNYRPKEATTK